ncbi:MAG: hypothetical protein DLM69_02240 [Candidatus Chloroheliales bacterium]|nr:MAG: hypothetical protein DLM69_02240 [Chloroflexota bacterium]
MPYEASDVLSQIRKDAAQARALLNEQRGALELAAELYQRACERLADWSEIVRSKQGNKYRLYANPLVNSHSVALDYPSSPSLPAVGYCVVATDSSFIEPDKHRGAFCHLINVGRVMIKYGDPQAAVLEARPFHRPDYLNDIEERYVGFGRALQAECTAKEIEHLLDLAVMHRADIAFFDGPLNQTVLLLENAPVISRRVKENLKVYYEYLRAFETVLGGSGIPVVGYNSRTNSDLVMRSLRKAVEAGLFSAAVRNDPRVPMFSYLDDGDLFSYVLAPGVRSITFQPWEAKKSADKAADESEGISSGLHEYEVDIRVFYLNVGGSAERVDVPVWCLPQLDRIHQLLLSQCTLGDDFPAALSLADKQAVLTRGEDRETYYTLLEMEDLLRPVSYKARSKREAGRNI